MTHFRNRIVGLRYIPAGQLVPRADNWRIHPAGQRSALVGLLKQVGVINAVIARELEDGSYELIDGHLRREELTGQVATLVVDLSDEEAALALASLDKIAGAAEADEERYETLLQDLRIESQGLAELLRTPAGQEFGDRACSDAGDIDEAAVDELAAELAAEGTGQASGTPASVVVPTSYAITVLCRDADDQRALYERLRGEGRKVKVLTI